MSRKNINNITFKRAPQNESDNCTYIGDFPWCGLIVKEKLSPSCMLTVKGLNVERRSSKFSLAFPKKHHFRPREDITPHVTKTGRLFLYFLFQHKCLTHTFHH